MKNSSAQKNKTKNLIFSTFWNLYQTKSIDKITVSELTKLAGINRSTFYAYFEDMYNVLDQFENRMLPTQDKVHRMCEKAETQKEIFEKMLAGIDYARPYYRFLLGEHGDPNFSVKLKNALIPMYKTHLSDETLKDPKLNLYLEFSVSAAVATFTYWLTHDTGFSSEELFEVLHDLSVKGSLHVLHPNGVHPPHDKPFQ